MIRQVRTTNFYRIYEIKGLREAIIFAAMFNGFLWCENDKNIWSIAI